MEGIALRTANASDRIALRGVRVLARVAGMSQRTTVEQTFVNLEPRAIEVVYTFPLPEGAAVCGFEVITGDRVLTGAVDESDRAIERYDDAIAEGDGAFLMEQERPDVFTVRVGNLKPRQAATIRLTYVCPLERVDKQIRVAFPTTVAPRYVTATATDPLEAMVDGDALNPPHAMWVPYGLSIRVEVELGRKLANVYSSSHSIRVERTADDRAVVTLAAGITEMNRDVVLSLELQREHEPSVQLERGGPDDKDYLAVTFVPEFEVDELAEPAPADVVFVLDCSGSMAGESIAQAKAALELCLRSLSPGDTFNVCRFGSRFQLMASEPLAYSQETLDAALTFVRDSGDLGGTELHAPLETIFAVPPRAGCIRQVILLTDGQVSNEPAVIELARGHRGHNRLFTFGIGPACSAFLVKGLARATGGAAEFITAGERIDEKVLRTFSRLASPLVSDVAIDWDGCDVQTLAELPPVFDGDVMAVFGRAAGRAPKRVTLSCQTPAGPKRWTVPVGPPADFGGTVATMWARRMIQSLEEVSSISTIHKAGKSRERDLLVSLSKQFGLLCSLTTFIAIEHRSVEERSAGKPALRRLPVKLAAGWGGVGSYKDVAASGGARGVIIASALPAPMPASDLYDSLEVAAPGLHMVEPRQPPSFLAQRRRLKQALKPASGKGCEPPARRATGVEPAPVALNLLLGAQGAEGWFGWTTEVYTSATTGPAEYRKEVELRLAHWLGGVDGRVSETVAALLLLQTHFARDNASWRRAYGKALRWLAGAVGRSAPEVESLIRSIASESSLTALVRT